MTAKEFQKEVTGDQSDFLDRFLALLARLKIDYCVIDDLAVNAYAEPVVTLDCDIVVVAARLPELEKELRAQFRVESFAHSLNVSASGSDVRVQIQTDARYQSFLPRRQPTMSLWRQHVFAFLTRNTLGATAYFRIPPSQVVELGSQVEL